MSQEGLPTGDALARYSLASFSSQPLGIVTPTKIRCTLVLVWVLLRAKLYYLRSYGICHKAPQTEQFRQQKSIVSQISVPEAQDRGVGRVGTFPGKTLFQASPLG